MKSCTKHALHSASTSMLYLHKFFDLFVFLVHFNEIAALYENSYRTISSVINFVRNQCNESYAHILFLLHSFDEKIYNNFIFVCLASVDSSSKNA